MLTCCLHAPHCHIAELLVTGAAEGVAVPLFSGDSTADPMLLSKLGGRPSLLQNLTVTTVSPGTADFISAFQKANPDVLYQAYVSHAWDALRAGLQAYVAAPPPREGAGIREQLSRQNFTGRQFHRQQSAAQDLL
jgi:hypothetical protein